MNAFQVCGYSKCGKTTLIKELISRFHVGGERVASIKDIHFEDFRMDEPGKNTYVHMEAGANPVVARGMKETDFLYSHRMEFQDIVPRIAADWLMVEGLASFPLPKIVCGKTEKDVDEFLDRRTFAVSGIFAGGRTEYKSLPVFDVNDPEQMLKLVKLIKQKVFPLLPYVGDDCCKLCGLTCGEMVEAIIQGEKTYSDCKIGSDSIRLKIGGRDVAMVPFVQNLLKSNVLAVISELHGWQPGQPVEVFIDSK